MQIHMQQAHHLKPHGQTWTERASLLLSIQHRHSQQPLTRRSMYIHQRAAAAARRSQAHTSRGVSSSAAAQGSAPMWQSLGAACPITIAPRLPPAMGGLMALEHIPLTRQPDPTAAAARRMPPPAAARARRPGGACCTRRSPGTSGPGCGTARARPACAHSHEGAYTQTDQLGCCACAGGLHSLAEASKLAAAAAVQDLASDNNCASVRAATSTTSQRQLQAATLARHCSVSHYRARYPKSCTGSWW